MVQSQRVQRLLPNRLQCNLPDVLEKSPQFFTTYPELVNRAAKTLFTVDGVDKMTKQREITGSFKSARKFTGLVGDAIKLWRATR